MGRRWVVLTDVTRGRLKVAEDELAFRPVRTHSRLARIFSRLARSPGRKRPAAASASFSRTRGGVSVSSVPAPGPSGQTKASNSARSAGDSQPDALHTQDETARQVVLEGGGDNLFT